MERRWISKRIALTSPGKQLTSGCSLLHGELDVHTKGKETCEFKQLEILSSIHSKLHFSEKLVEGLHGQLLSQKRPSFSKNSPSPKIREKKQKEKHEWLPGCADHSPTTNPTIVEVFPSRFCGWKNWQIFPSRSCELPIVFCKTDPTVTPSRRLAPSPTRTCSTSSLEDRPAKANAISILGSVLQNMYIIAALPCLAPGAT